ncbi:TIGR04255 family protein [candidate division WOR-3 bacterium]|nr:TIGR04255 family protein [candidate division WOR-3 bacterium]
MAKRYKNPPIVQAVVEIKFPAELSIECRKDEYYEKIRKDFPNILVPVIDRPDPYPLRNYKFETMDKFRMITFSINRFSYHTKRYVDFKEFSTMAIKYSKMFCDLYKISSLKRIGLRYINHINITRQNGLIPIDKYLNFGYKLPESIPSNFDLFQSILLSKFDDAKLRILINSEPTQAGGEIIVLDFDFSYEGELVTDDYADYLNKSHGYTKCVFEDIISSEYKKFMKKGE